MIRKESELSFRQKENSDCQLAIGQKKKKFFLKFMSYIERLVHCKFNSKYVKA